MSAALLVLLEVLPYRFRISVRTRLAYVAREEIHRVPPRHGGANVLPLFLLPLPAGGPSIRAC